MLASIAAVGEKQHLLRALQGLVEEFGPGRLKLRSRLADGQEILDISGTLAPARRTDFRRAVGYAVAHHILNDLEPQLLARICQRTYRYLDGDERAAVLALAGRSVHESGLDPAQREEHMAEKVADYLKDDVRLNVHGFITFRLQEYVDDLEDAVDRAIDDFLMEREYTEFVRLLRYFVEAQAPRMSQVHVTAGPEGAFRLFDATYRPVDGGNLKEFILDTVDSEVAYEDFLVSALISLAPERIVIHDSCRQGDEESITTVRNVFLDRVTLCRGCSFCASEERART